MQDQPSTKIHKLGANSTRRISLQSGTQCIGQTRQGDSRSFWIVKATWIRILVFGAGICALSKLDNDRGQRVVTVDLDFSLRADHNSATSFCYVPLCGCTGQEFEYTDCYERGNCHWLVPRTFQAGVPNSRPVPRRKQGVNCEWNALEICVVPTDSQQLKT